MLTTARRLRALIFIGLISCASSVLQAQTADQVRLLDTLSPEQRQAIMQNVDPSTVTAPAPVVAAAGATLGGQVEAAARKTNTAKMEVTSSADEGVFGVGGLSHYGYDLFNEAPSTFAPVTEIPVPADYVMGPGDQLVVQLYGNATRTTRLLVGRDGVINFPELGPITVGGKSFSSVQSDLEARVSKQMVGVNVSVSMGDTRSIRIFVLGEANRPGSYTVSGLSTMTGALFASGGIKLIGSLRNVQLKRQGAVVRTLDLYDLLMRGDSNNDAKLLPGDVIYAPTVGTTVAIHGAVKRPAIYELKGSETVSDLVKLAGGLTANADAAKVSLSRIDSQGKRVVVDVTLKEAARAATALRNGDSVTVYAASLDLDSAVTLGGHVFTPRNVAWRQGMRLTDLIPSVDELKSKADLHYVLIRRELQPERLIEVFSADLSKALANKGGASDPVLQARDRVTVFDFGSDRGAVVKDLLGELRLQSQSLSPTESVSVTGRIKVSGEYPLEAGMKVSDLIRAGGSLQEAAYTLTAELVRHRNNSAQKLETDIISIDLAAVVAGNQDADIKLQSEDTLVIKELPQWADRGQVTLSGEVKFPGTYKIQRGETLRQLIERAGGLTDQAFIPGGVFTRLELKDREQQQLDQLASRMQMDLTLMSLEMSKANNLQQNASEQTNANQEKSSGQQLLANLKNTKAVGRLVIDLERVIDAKDPYDVLLKDGDALVIPKTKQEVSVIGEVQFSTSHFYAKELSRTDYIEQSGGITLKADKSRIYVVRANGRVIANNSSWFGVGSRIQPGDTIVVPIDTERMPTLTLWQSVTQIIYNIAIAAAAVHSF